MHGLNEGHIAPYTDIEIQLTKYQTHITMKSQDKSLQLIFFFFFFFFGGGGVITVHGLNEGHIAPYTDIEFRLTKYQTYIIMKF